MSETRAQLLDTHKLANEIDSLQDEFGNNLESTLALTRSNNTLLGSQGNSLRGIDDKNRKIHQGVLLAEQNIKEMEQSEFIKKLMLRLIAVLLTILNVVMVLRALFG